MSEKLILFWRGKSLDMMTRAEMIGAIVHILNGDLSEKDIRVLLAKLVPIYQDSRERWLD